MIYLAICVGLTTFFLALAFVTRPASGPAEQRLQRLAREPAKSTESKDASAILDDDNPARAFFVRLIARFAGSAALEGTDPIYGKVRQRLIEAGFRRRSALAIYMGSRMALGAALAALTVLGSWFLGRTPPLLIIGMAAAIGYILPGVVVDRLRSTRQATIQRGLADAIDMMVVCVEAGLGLQATMSRVGRELSDSEPLIAGEFRATVAETQAGRGLMTALRSMAKRTGNQDLNALVALLVQTERFGTPLIQTLRTQADSMRYERMQRAEETAQKAPVKMMIPASLIFLAVILILAGPAALNISRTLPG
jgi:tight adherence protein C